MPRSTAHRILAAGLLAACLAVPGFACTNYIVTRGASADGSINVTYSADSHTLYGELYYTPAREHLEGEMLDVYEWDTGKYLGQIKQAPKTFAVVGNMNEHQLVIGETTFGGRKECEGGKGSMDYGGLIYITLQRAKTAREAIRIMGEFVREYGYVSEGETFSIADTREAWIMDLIGKGPDAKGAVWVARRVPDGYICAHANQARIRQFPLNDPENCIYSPDVITFAREKGFFKGEDKDFSFVDAYAPPDFGALRACEARVYAFFNRAAPSLKLPTDYVMGNPKAEPLPLWIKPDRKLSVRDVMELMRDHFEGTPMDMTRDLGAGPYVSPYRWRPMAWKVDGQDYFNERATSTQQTGFSFVSQAREWLPDPIGGVLWFGVDDTYSTVYFPAYCGIREIPHNFAVGTGDFGHFTWDSAWWVFNFVANQAYSRYCDMIRDIQVVQRELEGQFAAAQPSVEAEALAIHKESPDRARDFLTAYSGRVAEQTVKRWRKLGEALLVKYLDGNVRDEKGNVKHPGYPESWYRAILKAHPDQFKVPKSDQPQTH